MNPRRDEPAPLALLARRLRDARRVVAITGAGVSAESGLRTFRGATVADLPADMQALWKEFDPASLATPEAFDANPAMVTKWYDWRRLGCLAAEPNPGHAALAELEHQLHARGGTLTLLTQNVDRLHQRAGSTNVVELHGSIIDWRCTRTGRRVTPDAAPMPAFPPPSPFDPAGLLRPDVVWFGEALPEDALTRAGEAAVECDVFLSLGTSAVVYPAAAFSRLASSHGAFTGEINLEATPISNSVDVSIRARTGDALPRVVELAFGEG
ncbi:MAG: NAD-dependent deacylase [Planctomycetota bacterium]|nr:NAD-dependent deacylase [Planctomycetota bacterium]